ncbi:MAG: hypothetical protein HY051_04075 [Candidatus Aenigmarchaeota archaeon]|nr:hypothetical protein [Candidatus Aenigmarchaeota archaeon]
MSARNLLEKERFLYINKEHGFVVPAFASFCASLGQHLIDELYLKEQGTGLYLKASKYRSRDIPSRIDFTYKPQSLVFISNGNPTDPESESCLYLRGNEQKIEEFLALHANIKPGAFRVSSRNEMNELLSRLEGKKIKSAIIDPAIGGEIYAGLLNGSYIFSAGLIPVNTEDTELDICMDDNLVSVTTTSPKDGIVKYLPREIDR